MSCRTPHRNEAFSTCPSNFRPVINKAVASLPVRLTFYMQTLLVLFNGAVAAEIQPPSGVNPMSPEEKLKEEMRMLTRRRKSGMEAFSLLMAMDATMAFTSYILAFAPGNTLDFHSALIVLYLLVLSWVTVVLVTPFYIRLKITFNNCLLKFLIFIHNCLIFSYVIVLLATAPSFGPTFCCNYTAKGVVLVSFSALGTGRLVGWAVASILILVYLLHLSGRCTPTWKRRSQPSLESHDSIRSIPQTRNFTVSSNTGATSSRHATETTGEIGQVTQKSKREGLSSEKPGTTGHAITEPVNSLTGENTPTNTSKSSPIVELAGDTNTRDGESTKGHTRTSISDSVSQAQSVSTVLTEDGMNDEELGESLEFLKAVASANLLLFLGYFIFWLISVIDVELLIYRNNFVYDISIDLVEQFSMLDAIDFAQTLQFSQVLTFFIPFVHVHDTIERVHATYLRFRARHSSAFRHIGRNLKPSRWFSTKSKSAGQGGDGTESV